MASNVTNRAVLPAAVREYYDRLVLLTAYPKLVHGKFAQRRVLPEKMGDTIVFRRYSKLETVTVPLQDGITPPGAPLSVQDIKARIDFYGNFVTITNEVELIVEDRVLNEATRLLAQNLGQTIDEITRDVLMSITSVTLASQGSNLNTPTEITNDDIQSVVKTLLNNDADMITEIIPGRDTFAAVPVRQAFWGIIHTELLDDLEEVSTFTSVANYASPRPTLEEEWGATNNVRWAYTSIAYKSSASPAVYHLPILGKEAYGMVHLGSEKGEFYVEPLGSAGSSDPLHQRGSVGWSHPYTARVLNDNFGNLLLVTHS